MLEALQIECQRGDQRLFQGLNFCLNAGELLFLQGNNGAGKTSLLRMLCGLSEPVSGEIRWRGENIRRMNERFRGELCYLGHQNAIKEDLTPLENLMVSTRLHDETLDEDAALKALVEVGLSGRAELACRYLSQGQKRRVALARFAQEKRPLWILDEPFVALDTQATRWLSQVIGAHVERGGLVVLTSHQAIDIPAGRIHPLFLG
ncbi:MAG: cytochrome c biogenesis heme-transporting ATPase CcmA [Zoogloeaceae bacterium]|jgi:heme exporter protein A|nr:cytochrome c biogenesis heme-transporting ATPase CcmA [Zoogloeaceae bacterium]